jgi:hypothetical protein
MMLVLEYVDFDYLNDYQRTTDSIGCGMATAP